MLQTYSNKLTAPLSRVEISRDCVLSAQKASRDNLTASRDNFTASRDDFTASRGVRAPNKAARRRMAHGAWRMAELGLVSHHSTVQNVYQCMTFIILGLSFQRSTGLS